MLAGILWEAVRDCFESDDGSLPTLVISRMSPSEIGQAYQWIRQSSRLVDPDASFWDYTKQSERRLDEVPNAALLVVRGQAAGFAFAVDGIVRSGVRIPRLGVEVFSTVIAVNYKMGSEWGPREVHAFFAWLKDLVALAIDATLTVDKGEPPPDAEAFMRAWNEFAG